MRFPNRTRTSNSGFLYRYLKIQRMAKHLVDKPSCLTACQRRCEKLVAIRWIQLKIKEGFPKGQTELLLRPHLIFTTSIELIPILTRMLDLQCARSTIDKICLPPSRLSRSSRRVRSWGLVSIRATTQANASYQMPAFRRHIDLDSGHLLLRRDLSE